MIWFHALCVYVCKDEYESERKRALSVSVETANPIRIDCFGNHAQIITSFYPDNFFLSCVHFSSHPHSLCLRFRRDGSALRQPITIFDDDEIKDHHNRKIRQKRIRNRINGYIYIYILRQNKKKIPTSANQIDFLESTALTQGKKNCCIYNSNESIASSYYK